MGCQRSTDGGSSRKSDSEKSPTKSEDEKRGDAAVGCDCAWTCCRTADGTDDGSVLVLMSSALEARVSVSISWAWFRQRLQGMTVIIWYIVLPITDVPVDYTWYQVELYLVYIMIPRIVACTVPGTDTP